MTRASEANAPRTTGSGPKRCDAFIKTALVLLALLLVSATTQTAHAAFGPLQEWGELGDGPGDLYAPLGLAVAPAANTIYIADSENNRVQRLSLSGVATGEITQADGSDLAVPASVAVAGDGSIYVIDETDKIYRFNSDLSFDNQWGSSGSGVGEFSWPQAVAVDPSNGDLYVADTFNDRIQRLPAGEGAEWEVFTSEGLNFPFGVAVNGDGYVYVADTFNNQIKKFNSEGDLIGSPWGGPGTGAGQFDLPVGITVDGSGDLYVTDSENNRFQRLSADGAFLGAWGQFGYGLGQFYSPSGIATDSAGNVYIADTGNDRIQKFGQLPTAAGPGPSGPGIAPTPAVPAPTSTVGAPTPSTGKSAECSTADLKKLKKAKKTLNKAKKAVKKAKKAYRKVKRKQAKLKTKRKLKKAKRRLKKASKSYRKLAASIKGQPCPK